MDLDSELEALDWSQILVSTSLTNNSGQVICFSHLEIQSKQKVSKKFFRSFIRKSSLKLLS